jgi:hypothetical protein
LRLEAVRVWLCRAVDSARSLLKSYLRGTTHLWPTRRRPVVDPRNDKESLNLSTATQRDQYELESAQFRLRQPGGGSGTPGVLDSRRKKTDRGVAQGVAKERRGSGIRKGSRHAEIGPLDAALIHGGRGKEKNNYGMTKGWI